MWVIAHEVHCWCFSSIKLPQAELNQDELHRLNTLAAPRAHYFNAGRRALRWLLGYYLGDNLARQSITTDSYGKPRLTVSSDFYFSLAHIESELLIALGNAPIGVDLETHDRPLNPTSAKRIATRFFNTPLKTSNFLRQWTAYEATQKLTGTGVFSRFHQPASLVDFDTPLGNPAALACASGAPKIRFFTN